MDCMSVYPHSISQEFLKGGSKGAYYYQKQPMLALKMIHSTLISNSLILLVLLNAYVS